MWEERKDAHGRTIPPEAPFVDEVALWAKMRGNGSRALQAIRWEEWVRSMTEEST